MGKFWWPLSKNVIPSFTDLVMSYILGSMARSQFPSMFQRKVSLTLCHKDLLVVANCKIWAYVRYLNASVLSIITFVSTLALVVKAINHYKHINNKDAALHKPLKNSHLPTFNNYGATAANGESDNESSSSSETMVSSSSSAQGEVVIRQEPWSVYNGIRLILSVIQLILVISVTWSFVHSKDDIDVVVEGSYQDMFFMYYTRIVFWVSLPRKKKRREA